MAVNDIKKIEYTPLKIGNIENTISDQNVILFNTEDTTPAQTTTTTTNTAYINALNANADKIIAALNSKDLVVPEISSNNLLNNGIVNPEMLVLIDLFKEKGHDFVINSQEELPKKLPLDSNVINCYDNSGLKITKYGHVGKNIGEQLSTEINKITDDDNKKNLTVLAEDSLLGYSIYKKLTNQNEKVNLIMIEDSSEKDFNDVKSKTIGSTETIGSILTKNQITLTCVAAGSVAKKDIVNMKDLVLNVMLKLGMSVDEINKRMLMAERKSLQSYVTNLSTDTSTTTTEETEVDAAKTRIEQINKSLTEIRTEQLEQSNQFSAIYINESQNIITKDELKQYFLGNKTLNEIATDYCNVDAKDKSNNPVFNKEFGQKNRWDEKNGMIDYFSTNWTKHYWVQSAFPLGEPSSANKDNLIIVNDQQLIEMLKDCSKKDKERIFDNMKNQIDGFLACITEDNKKADKDGKKYTLEQYLSDSHIKMRFSRVCQMAGICGYDLFSDKIFENILKAKKYQNTKDFLKAKFTTADGRLHYWQEAYRYGSEIKQKVEGEDIVLKPKTKPKKPQKTIETQYKKEDDKVVAQTTKTNLVDQQSNLSSYSNIPQFYSNNNYASQPYSTIKYEKPEIRKNISSKSTWDEMTVFAQFISVILIIPAIILWIVGGFDKKPVTEISYGKTPQFGTKNWETTQLEKNIHPDINNNKTFTPKISVLSSGTARNL